MITAVITGIILLIFLSQLGKAKAIARNGLWSLSPWIPVVLLDTTCVLFLIGILSWYRSKSSRLAGEIMTGYLIGLLCICITVSMSIFRNRAVGNKSGPAKRQ